MWTPVPLTEALNAGVPVSGPYVSAVASHGGVPDRWSGGHLLRVRVPAGGAVVDASDDTFALPVAWLGPASGVTVEAVLELGPDGRVANGYRVVSGPALAVRQVTESEVGHQAFLFAKQRKEVFPEIILHQMFRRQEPGIAQMVQADGIGIFFPGECRSGDLGKLTRSGSKSMSPFSEATRK